jgi:hypothetical protein
MQPIAEHSGLHDSTVSPAPSWVERADAGLATPESSQRILDLFAVIDWMMRLPDPLEQALWNEVQTIEGERKMA